MKKRKIKRVVMNDLIDVLSLVDDRNKINKTRIMNYYTYDIRNVFSEIECIIYYV